MLLFPKLGPVRAQQGQRDGRPALILAEALGLADAAIQLPPTLGLLPALCDGTRDLDALRAALLVRAGVRLSSDTLAHIIEQMDRALLFENGARAAALSQALERYRQAPARPSVSAGISYPADAEPAGVLLDACWADAGIGAPLLQPAEMLRGVVSPHIDFARGGAIYAGVWKAAQPAVAQADLVVLLGTDHRGTAGALTLTRQDYLTPWGVLPTDGEAVETLAEAIGATAFVEEYHHALEHSVELAAVWLRYTAGRDVRMLPVLCGPFELFSRDERDAGEDEILGAAVAGLRGLARGGRRVLYVAAADLAHLGPAFDGAAVDFFGRGRCAGADEALLGAVRRGDAGDFLRLMRVEGNRRNVCGAPPIYLLLRALEPAAGQTTGYQQCLADARGESIVSIAGALLW